MKILHVLDHSLPVQSGYAFRSAAILREQRRLGWETIQVTGPKQGSSETAAEYVDGLEYLRTGALAGWLAGIPAGAQLDVVLRLRRLLQTIIARENPDLIQAHSPCLNALAALGLGRPVVYEFRSSWEDAAVSNGTTTEGSLRYRASRWLETRILRRANAVTTICQGLRNEAIARGVPADRIAVIPNAVEANSFRSVPGEFPRLKARWGLDGRYILGFIGSFFAWEGLGLLLEVLPQIRVARPDVAVLLVGGGVDEPALRRAVARLGLESSVVFAGQLPHAQIAEAYGAIDLLIYPRLPMRLTEMVTPLKPLEAMAMGKPLLASDVGGHRELIEDGTTGLLFRAGDARALADTVLRVLGDPALPARLRDLGQRYVREQRTWARSVRGYESVYRRLIETRRP